MGVPANRVTGEPKLAVYNAMKQELESRGVKIDENIIRFKDDFFRIDLGGVETVGHIPQDKSCGLD